MAEQESVFHNDDDKMVYEFKNSKNDPHRELTKAQAEKQLKERTGSDESASTTTATTRSTSTSKEK